MKTLSQSPTDPGFVKDPYPFYARARAEGPLVFWEDYDLPVTTTFEATNTILRDRRFGREVPPELAPEIAPHLAPFYAVEAHSMLELEPPRHTRLRGLVLRAFTSRRIAALAPEIEALCHQLIDEFPDEPFDLLPSYAQKIPVIIIARLLGVPETMADQLLAWSNAMVAMYQARRTREIEDAAVSATQDFVTFMRGYVDERRAKPADDLITHLIAAEEDGEKLSTDELITTCILLLNAGHEATVHTMGNGIKALLEHGCGPEVLTPDKIDGTVEEILRYDPPLHMFTRHAYEEVELFGHRFQRGDKVACLLGAANRDPQDWPAPDRFDPSRPISANLAFGVGLHFCVGAPLARLELRTALPALWAGLPSLRLDERPRYADLYHFHGLMALRVRHPRGQ
ncbi:MAG: cytochrome P450 [Rhodobacteraceae bacterium]|nr:cytochrome P450 [Paracoccaceae bacterium]